MADRLKYAVIGAGNMGRNHIRTLSELEREVELVAICDTKEDAGMALAAAHGATYYQDYLDMLQQEEIDMVSICVPTRIHHRVGKDCILLGLNILLEKPICHEVESAQELLDLAVDNKITLMVGHTERFNPAVIKAKEIVDSGAIGTIMLVNARRLGGLPAQLRDNNAALDLAIHDIDIINLLLNEYPAQVSTGKGQAAAEPEHDIEFVLHYESATANIRASWTSPEKIRQLEIIGTRGTLKLDYMEQTLCLYADRSMTTPQKVFEIAGKQPLAEEIMHLIDCVRENRRIDSQFAVEALRIATNDDGKVRL